MNLPKGSLIAIAIPSLAGGGAERAMLTLAKGLLERGYLVDLVLANHKGALKEEIPTGVRIFNFNTSRVFFTILPLIKYLRKNKPQVLYSTPIHLNIVVILAKMFSFVQTKVIVREANVPISSLKNRTAFSAKFVYLLIPLIYPFAKKIIAVSQDVKEELIALSPRLQNKINVIVNPVVSAEFFLRAEEPIRDPWFEQPDVSIIVGMGRLHPQKDFPTLIKAFAEVKKNFNAKLVIFGEGQERKNLENLISSLGLNNDIRLMGFVLNPFPYLKRAKVFVLSSLYEGMPNVLIQAMALNVPVVTTNCKGGMQEALDSGRFGKSVPVGDSNKMAEAISASLKLPPQPELGIYAQEKFGLNPIVDQYLQVAS